LLKPGVTLVGDPASNGSTTTIVDGGTYSVGGGLHAGTPLSVAVVMGAGSSLSGVQITVSGTSGVGVVFDGSTASLTNCTLSGCGVSGVQVYQAASPTLASNIISQSGASGVATYDTSAPLLRQNTISSSAAGAVGVLASDTSIPNLGDAVSPGANLLQSNTQESLTNATTSSAIPAAGNTWNASVQGADPQGQYPSGPANPALIGTNYSITNSPAATIQF
ncbi:MAG TPA: right-handed parallel beta-helix repeat-containing protein, partial [Planctomycetota bacterium]|nr:right-handed parallel beta-helix repeat-containing protein [Planctomycetota bacterium]